MPSGRVIQENEVWLNGRFYRIDGGVKRDLISRQPPKISIGPFTKDDNPVVSTITWTKIIGTGSAVIETDEDYSKAYYTFMPTLDGVIPTNVNPGSGVVVATADGFDGRFFAPGTTSTLYIITGVSVEVTTGTSLAAATLVSATTHTLAGTPTDSTWGFISTVANSTVLKQYLVAGGASGIDYSQGPPYNTWTSHTQPVRYITFFQDRLWAINSSNEIMFTPSPGTTWTAEAKIPASSGSVTGLLVAPSEDAPEALYVVSDQGLYLYDPENTRFAYLNIAAEPARFSGRGAVTWQGSIFYPAGMGLYQYTPQTGTVVSMGLNRREGLPEFLSGVITGMAVSGKYLYAQVGSQSIFSIYEGIYRWDGRGWDQIIRSTALTTTNKLTTRPYAWFDQIGGVNRLAMQPPGGIAAQAILPEIQSAGVDWDTAYKTSKAGGVSTQEIVLPWIKRDSDQRWLAVAVQMDVTNVQSSQYIEIAYGLDYSTTFTSIGGTSASGTVEHLLTTAASTNDQQGIVFDAIRLKVTGRSSRTSVDGSPLLKRLTFTYKKSFKPIYSFTFIADATEAYKGYTPMQIREGLEAVSTTPTLVEFTFKDELSATNVSEQHWVALQEMQSAEQTGKDNSKFIVTLSEAL